MLDCLVNNPILLYNNYVHYLFKNANFKIIELHWRTCFGRIFLRNVHFCLSTCYSIELSIFVIYCDKNDIFILVYQILFCRILNTELLAFLSVNNVWNGSMRPPTCCCILWTRKIVTWNQKDLLKTLWNNDKVMLIH